MEFDMPIAYPATSPEIKIPELEGKTAKMYQYVSLFFIFFLFC